MSLLDEAMRSAKLLNTIIIVIMLCPLLSRVANSQETSDTLWAEAGLLQLSTNSTNGEVEGMLLLAIQAAKEKGPIQIALGNHYRHPHVMSNVPNGHMDKLPQHIADTKTRMLKAYEAAAKSDPTLSLAWLHLAMSDDVDEPVKSNARANIKKWDPKNALFDYLEAFDLAKKGDPLEAFVMVKAGNQKTLSIPASPYPRNHKIVFPDSREFKEAGMVGKPVPNVLLKLHAQALDPLTLLHFSMRAGTIATTLTQQAEHLESEGHIQKALEYLAASANLGLSMVHNKEGESTLCLSGLRIAQDAIARILEHEEHIKTEGVLNTLNTLNAACRIYLEGYQKFLDEPVPFEGKKDHELLGSASKIEDYLKKKSAFEQQLLKKAALTDIRRLDLSLSENVDIKKPRKPK